MQSFLRRSEQAIEGWLQRGYQTSPLTNVPLASAELLPNHALRNAIEQSIHQVDAASLEVTGQVLGESTFGRVRAGWLRVGFCQGNFNADNCLVGGRTMDYGPFGWLERYDPMFAKWTGSGEHFAFINQARDRRRPAPVPSLAAKESQTGFRRSDSYERPLTVLTTEPVSSSRKPVWGYEFRFVCVARLLAVAALLEVAEHTPRGLEEVFGRSRHTPTEPPGGGTRLLAVRS